MRIRHRFIVVGVVAAVALVLGTGLARAARCDPIFHPCNEVAYLPVVRKAPPPTATPLPTATPPWYVTDAGVWKEARDGDMLFTGEFVNSTDQPQLSPDIKVNLRDDQGNILITEGAWVSGPQFLPPHERSCFSIYLRRPFPVRMASYDFELAEAWDYGQKSEDHAPLIVSDLRSSMRSSSVGRSFRVEGKVTNPHERRADHASVFVTLYDSGRRVVGCDGAFVEGHRDDPIWHGRSREFWASFGGYDYSDVDDYRVKAYGWMGDL